ncbi:MAG: SulP family inorganic anion transporter [Bacteroidetes bacterium]|nr:SulP family inorganic anion transporter [Bacteroidota bacterium]
MINKRKIVAPADGLVGLKENIQADSLSGFLVFLLALPLSLGIAKASEFPPIMGLITAMIGGLIVALISGSRLTIKGPAAGLIVIVAGSVSELGGGNNELGWHLALGAVVVAGIFQVLFGVFKFGKLADFFPLAAVEGMLAAIGIIILSKQIHVLLGINPVNEVTGKPLVEPLELIELLPHSFVNFNSGSTIIGIVSLIIIFGMPIIKHPLIKKIPAPLIVLLVTVPLAIIIGLKDSNPKGFVHFDKGLFDIFTINVSFAGLSQTAVFIKYVVMFALVGSLEALLTIKAIDVMDPYKRKSNYNQDLMAIGVGNIIAGVLGGLPMISEVARSSANVNYGGKTRFANFFHGIAILIFLIFATIFSDLIPTSALAAMLIGVGAKLTHPRVFKHMFHIGVEQLTIFIVTIIVTLSTDLLVGIGVGILTKIVIHFIYGLYPKSVFKSNVKIQQQDENTYLVKIKYSAVFSNYIGLIEKLSSIPKGKIIIVDFKQVNLIDHTSFQGLYFIGENYKLDGGEFQTIGLDRFKPMSQHPMASRHKRL